MSEIIRRERVETLKDVPPDKLGEVVMDFKDSGARTVTQHLQSSGDFEVEAVFERAADREDLNKPFFATH